jgi:eukaryotic-like serine/threonine-protein kinase
MADAQSPRYAASGHLLFQRASSDELMSVRFDAARLAATGPPVRLASVARTFDGGAAYAIARDGTLIYSQPGEVADQVGYTLVAVDRSGTESVLLEEWGGYAQPRISPDGRLLLYRRIATAGCQLWTLDLVRGTRTRVTVEGDNHDPVWHPGGREISWARAVSTGSRIEQAPVDRSDAPTSLVTSRLSLSPYSWSPDGLTLVYVQSGEATASDIWILDRRDGQQRPFAATRFADDQPAFSRNGGWLAWISDESGRNEVYVQRATGDGGRLQISVGGGHSPVWSPDGRELYYVEGQRLMSVGVRLEGTPEVARPMPIVEGSYAWERPGNYDVLPDGRFVFIKRHGAIGGTAVLRVVVNGLSTLR